MKQVNLLVHGVPVKLTTDDPDFFEYVRDNMFLFISDSSAEPAMEITYRNLGKGHYTIQPESDMERIGLELWQGPRSILQRRRGLETLCRSLEGGRLSIEARFHTLRERSRLRSLARGIARRGMDEEKRRHETCHYVARQCLHLPLFKTLLERRGLALIHASSVARNGKALIFAGLGGSGKSTLAAFFCANKGWSRMSDNFTLVCGDRVFAYPESPRISADMMNLLAGSHQGREVYGKVHLSEVASKIPETAEISAIYLISLGESAKIRPISAQECLARIEAMNDYLAEFPEHTYLRFLGEDDPRAHNRKVVAELLGRSRTYRLVQSWDADLDETYRLIEGTFPGTE